MGARERRELEARLSILPQHLMKWRYQPPSGAVLQRVRYSHGKARLPRTCTAAAQSAPGYPASCVSQTKQLQSGAGSQGGAFPCHCLDLPESPGVPWTTNAILLSILNAWWRVAVGVFAVDPILSHVQAGGVMARAGCGIPPSRVGLTRRKKNVNCLSQRPVQKRSDKLI